jgi:polar amino acid transport system substrate-binding protein
MLTDIYTAAGYELKFWEVPYARGMEMVAQGHCGSLPEKEFSSVAERDVVYATQPTFIYPTGFSVRAGDPWRYQGKPVATGQGWNYSSMSVAYQNDLDDPKNEQDIEMVAGHGKVVKRILHMIVAERVDLYADNLFVLQYVIDLAGLNEQIEIVTAELDNRLISELIFSGTFPRAKPNTLINIWDNGRQAIDKPQEKTYLQNYGITLW